MRIRQARWAIPAFAFLLVAGVPRDASAFWGIFERLSGPGPFPNSFRFSVDRVFGCVVKPEDGTAGKPEPEPRPKWTSIFGRGRDAGDKIECLTDGDRVVAYLSVEFTYAHSDKDDRFPAVTFTGYRPIMFFRVQESVDVGVGLGFNRFSGAGFPNTEFQGKEFGFWKWSVPLRARIFAPGLKSGSRWRGIHLMLQADYFPGFTTANFMAPAGPAIESGFVPSAFLGIDVLTLARGR